MGMADVIPGVSGGTIAFICGIYDELIDSLRRCDYTALKLLAKFRIKDAWLHVNGNFLLAVFGGVLISVLSFARLMTHLLDAAPILVWSFFFGLILSAGIYIARQISDWNAARVGLLVMGILFAVAISELRPAQLPEEWWVLSLAGAIAICAMILPGVSGSFLLLMMGLYQTFITALSEFDLVLLASFGIGCVSGLILFSHVLHWLLERFHAATMALLTGFMLGSLKVIWPWKQTLESIQNRHGEWVPVVQENLLPMQYAKVSGADSMWMMALVCLLVGLVLVPMIERIAHQVQR